MHWTVQAILAVCVIAITVALVCTLLSVRQTAIRAESVLQLVEREIRPLASQVEALAEELRGLSRQVTREVERVSVVMRRAEEVSLAVVRLVGTVGALTGVGRMLGLVVGVKKGLSVFVSRLARRR